MAVELCDIDSPLETWRADGGKFLDVYVPALCRSCITSCVSKSRFSFLRSTYPEAVENTVIYCTLDS